MTALSAVGKRWIEASPAAIEALELARDAGLCIHRSRRFSGSVVIARQEQVRAFLDPRLQSLGDPFLLTDLRPAAARADSQGDHRARETRHLLGDYDVDGITSSALLVARPATARRWMWRRSFRLRMEEGYGLSQDGAERCVEEHGSPRSWIVVDCGTPAVPQVAWLRERGIDVAIIDHHAASPPALPNANALVNPQRDGKLDYLASVGLAFKVCHGLLKPRRGGEGLKSICGNILDLVAVSNT